MRFRQLQGTTGLCDFQTPYQHQKEAEVLHLQKDQAKGQLNRGNSARQLKTQAW